MRVTNLRAGFIAVATAAAALPFVSPPSAVAADAATVVRVTTGPTTKPIEISDDFMGLGYETSAVAQDGYFSADNKRLVALYKNLSPRGMIRVGGIISDHTFYRPDAESVAATKDGETIINRQDVADLAAFAKATGWQVMWGLNLGTGTREEAVEQSLAVTEALGDHLHSLEIGNEVDLLGKYERKYDPYHADFVEYKKAIRDALPEAVFSGPDSALSVGFVEKFAEDEGDDVLNLTLHYYRGNWQSKFANLNDLLHPHDALHDKLSRLQKAADKHGLVARINEVNSYSGGGKAGLSDTFASALWALDYCFVLASHGIGGVNMQTDINQLGFISHYSPIVHDENGVCSARPEYYGLLAFAMSGHGKLLETRVDAGEANVTAYVTQPDEDTTFLTVINKDLTRDVTAEYAVSGDATAEAFRLAGPAIDAKNDVTFAAAAVAEDGSWSPGEGEPVAIEGRILRVNVPHASAVIVRISGS